MNLSAKNLKNLGINEGEINEYERDKIWHLALKLVGWGGHLIEFSKGDGKIYPQQTPEAVNLIRQLKQEKNFDVSEVEKELEERRTRFRE